MRAARQQPGDGEGALTGGLGCNSQQQIAARRSVSVYKAKQLYFRGQWSGATMTVRPPMPICGRECCEWRRQKRRAGMDDHSSRPMKLKLRTGRIDVDSPRLARPRALQLTSRRPSPKSPSAARVPARVPRAPHGHLDPRIRGLAQASTRLPRDKLAGRMRASLRLEGPAIGDA